METPSPTVRLYLLEPKPDSIIGPIRNPLYLDIPIEIFSHVCNDARKYLKYLGWSILGVAGEIEVVFRNLDPPEDTGDDNSVRENDEYRYTHEGDHLLCHQCRMML